MVTPFSLSCRSVVIHTLTIIPKQFELSIYISILRRLFFYIPSIQLAVRSRVVGDIGLRPIGISWVSGIKGGVVLVVQLPLKGVDLVLQGLYDPLQTGNLFLKRLLRKHLQLFVLPYHK